jgi:hypothetical protein
MLLNLPTYTIANIVRTKKGLYSYGMSVTMQTKYTYVKETMSIIEFHIIIEKVSKILKQLHTSVTIK